MQGRVCVCVITQIILLIAVSCDHNLSELSDFWQLYKEF